MYLQNTVPLAYIIRITRGTVPKTKAKGSFREFMV